MISPLIITFCVAFFFVYCGSIFDGRKDLTFCRFRVNIPPTASSPSKVLCSGSIFTTTYHPTVSFGAHGNSGDKRLKERVISRRKGYKVPEMPRKKLYYIFGTKRTAQTPNPENPHKHWVFRTFKSRFLRFDPIFDHNCGNYLSNNFISFITYRGVAQLVARDIWEIDR